MHSSACHATVNRQESTSVNHEFPTGSNTLITGGSFVNVEKGGVFNHQIHTPTHPPAGTERRGMRKLEKKIAPGAFHNSAERYDPPKCHPKTRIAVLNKIMDWVQGLEDSERRCYFMWLYGPAGAGKSAIAQSIAELCHELKLLAASFFFSRTSEGRNDHSRLIATLTYQLCLSIPEIRTYVEDAVELDPNIFSLSLPVQVRRLIIEPLSHFRDNLSHGRIHPMLIIIDGLDECVSAAYVQRFVLRFLSRNLPFPMLFLVASRPEPDIRGFFTAEPMAAITTTLALDDSYLPSSDIRVFLEARFDVIKKDHPLRGQLPEPWPSVVDIDHLVDKSSGQFIYASIVMKYVESPRHWPTDRLQIASGIMSRGNDTPFSALDALYTFIFSSVEDINKVLEVFSVLVLVKTGYILKTPALIEDLLDLRRDDLKITLIDLHSILDIPFEADAGEIRVLHAFLEDFLLDKSRSGDYHIDQGYAHANLALHLLRYIPQMNISNHEISVLHSLSSAIFTVHCAQSYPTAVLLDALWSSSTLTFWTSVYEIPPKGPRASQMSDFFTWLKNNGSSKEGQDLYSHYMLTWDRYIRQSLTQLSEPHMSQYILFFLLPQIPNIYKAADIFSWYSLDGGYHSLQNVSATFERHDGDLSGKYHLLLTGYFSDPSRSGPFYLDGDKYASFTITLTKYLIQWYVLQQTATIFTNGIGDTTFLVSASCCQRHPIRKNSQLS
ncbi:hypothetical protein BYT27DRAFT_6902536 [Phlegmacium glaucopus]|nr:hypothetical protein BYT27DRAFT_6902536 [Phlegmacium glaucopus]